MYINDTHILYYFFAGLIGLLVGQFIDWAVIRLKEDKKVLCREFFTMYLKNLKLNCYTMYINAALYIVLLLINGVSVQFLEYALLTPMLLTIAIVDFTKHKIPNRVLLTMFEVEVIFAAIAGFTDLSVFLFRLLGMVIGAGLFLGITWFGSNTTKKEVMGLGDVKLMGIVGLVFGLTNMIIISVLSFVMAAIYSLVLIIAKKKKLSSYIPFGPFIVIASLIVMLLPNTWLMKAILEIFTLGFYN